MKVKSENSLISLERAEGRLVGMTNKSCRQGVSTAIRLTVEVVMAYPFKSILRHKNTKKMKE